VNSCLPRNSALVRVLQAVGLCALMFLSTASHAQNLGRISGIITDSSGAVVSGAAVTVTDTERNIARNLTADSSGIYSAPNLIPSTYTVRAAYMGFSPIEHNGITVGVGDDVHIDLTLRPGLQAQTVTVTSEAPQISTTNAQLGGEVTGQSLTELPVAGHNFLQLMALHPGMQGRPGGGAAGQEPYANGLRAEYNVILFDGLASYTSYYPTSQPVSIGYAGGGPEEAIVVPADSVQDFTVVLNPKAEYGWRPGAQISMGMKSGTNTLHGAAFALGRDAALIARNPFFQTKVENTFENYGATLGGPIKSNKVFFLVSYEGQQEAVDEPRNATMPEFTSNAAQLSQFLTIPGLPNPAKFSMPAALQAMETAGTPISPLSLALTGCSTTTLLCSGAGLFSNTTASKNGLYPVAFPLTGSTNDGVGKIDYHMNDKNSFNGEYFAGKGSIIAPVSTITQQYWSANLYSTSQVARAVWTYIPNSSWVNDARFGWDYSLANENGLLDCNGGQGAPDYATLGLVSGSTICGLPTITIAGFNNLNGQGDSTAVSNVYRWSDSVSYTHGNHIFKFGGEMAFNTGAVNLNIQNSHGTINFNTNNAAVPLPGIASANATPLEYFFAGLPTSSTLQVGSVPRTFHYYQYAGYVQDDWRIVPRLTMNLGLRYEYMSTIWATDGFFANFAPGTPSGLVQQGHGGSLYNFDHNAFAPRFGFAWDVTGKASTILRGSFNIVYEQPTGQVFFSPGATLNINPSGLSMYSGCTKSGFTAAALATCTQGPITTPGGNITLASVTIAPPQATVPWVSGQSIFGNYTSATPVCTNQSPCAIGGTAQHLQFPEILEWNFGIQQALTSNLSLDVEYVGNKGQHEFAYTDLNQPALGPATNEILRRPYSMNGEYPWFGKIGELGSFGEYSNYDGLQVVLTARGFHGLSFVAGYTYAHALDEGSVDMGMVIPMNSLNPGLEYGNSASDLRHHFTIAPTYMVPSRKAPLQLLDGWQLSSSFTISSGRPYNAVDSTDDISGTGELQDRWTLAGTPKDFKKYGGAVPIPYFAGALGVAGLPIACQNAAAAEPNGPGGIANNDTGMANLLKYGCYMAGNSVIVPPAQGTFGTMSRYELFGPGFEEWDFSVSKAWRIKERLNATFRAEIYNVLNRTQYAAPTATLNTTGTFGQSQATPDVGANSPIIGTGGPRKIQLGLKFTF
jgi:hypothetical protein